ncbi:MAG: ABC transporter ATP-binding protein/permease, partial [Candidatus Tectomicrobia bacterium]|nr:ABC transporter ATP-binding protein/permease [Candidatus Tectomicrobia bacterium]
TLLVLLGASVAQLSLTIVAWWIIGQSVLSGRFDWGWSLGWALMLLTAIAFQMLSIAAQSQLGMNAGALFKQRLLYGSLQLELEEIRHLGAGQFLERVMESEAVEQLALGGGFAAVLALIQLVMATAILALGAGGWPHALLLVMWMAVTLGFCWRYLQKSHAWGETYRAMTSDLVERMVGHRTRLAQEDRQHWHDEEDQVLAHYVALSKTLDRSGALLRTLVPRGWPIVGLAGLAAVFLAPQSSLAQLAISLAGVLLALQALTRLVMGVQSIVGVTLAWKEVGPLFQAAARAKEMRSLDVVPLPEHQDPTLEASPVVTARGLSFSYRDSGRQVLQGCDLQIQYGNRLLLEGPSGGGKSTLAALLAGLRTTESGILLLWGYDRQTLGTVEWRRRVVVVPQFHENHVLTGTFAFNLLMGRRWPPRPEDLSEAEAVCRELGLGEVLDRMPASLQQMVGESGWQLSHGERSRLYIARALLQQADVLILDESFGALDPENLQRALHCVLQRAPTLLVIAHP